MWKLGRCKLPVRGFLHNRKVGTENECPICFKVVESTHHIFWEYTIAKPIWNFVESWWKIKITGNLGEHDIYKNTSKKLLATPLKRILASNGFSDLLDYLKKLGMRLFSN